MIKGACNCGAVAFEIDGEVDGVYVCHCSICRRFTGSNGIAVVVVDKAALHWVRGADRITTWKKPGADWEAGFCDRCGSAVPAANDASRMFVPAGTITGGGESLRVIHHLWVGSKATWDEIGDLGQQHREGLQPD